jgi:hypothetical protein
MTSDAISPASFRRFSRTLPQTNQILKKFPAKQNIFCHAESPVTPSFCELLANIPSKRNEKSMFMGTAVAFGVCFTNEYKRFQTKTFGLPL